ncbi:MAG: DNA repair protein RecO, partial [Acidobacteriota bacterium]
MRLHSSQAFVLGTHALRETDRIVSILTREFGKKRGVARGARRPRSAFGGALEPMTEADVVYYEKEGSDLVSIRSVDPIRASFSLSTDLERALLLPAMAESLETFVSESDPAEPFYRLARHAMDALFAGGSAASTAAYFDLWILKLSGLFPPTRECARCETALPETGPLSFDERLPGFLGPECASAGVRITAAGRRTLAQFLSGPLDPSADLPGLAEVAAVTRLSRRHFLGHELKSQRVLAEVLSSPSLRSGVCLRHRRAARPGAGSTARLTASLRYGSRGANL